MQYRMRKRLVSVGGDFDVEDADGEVVYRVDRKVRFAIRFVIRDREGNEVVAGREKLLSLDTVFLIARDGLTIAKINKKHLPSNRYRYTVIAEGKADIEVRGILVRDDYRLERGGTEIASVAREQLALRDAYDIHVEAGEDQPFILAIVFAIAALEPYKGD